MYSDLGWVGFSSICVKCLYFCRCGLSCLWTKSSVLVDKPDALLFETTTPPLIVCMILVEMLLCGVVHGLYMDQKKLVRYILYYFISSRISLICIHIYLIYCYIMIYNFFY